MPRLPPLEFRRLLRRSATDAENALWSRLRRGRMGEKFRRQHTLGPYTLDFYCPAARVAVELDGGQHWEDGQHARDLARDRWLAAQRIRVLRFTDRESLLETEWVAEVVWSAVNEDTPLPAPHLHPTPSPPARAGGEGWGEGGVPSVRTRTSARSPATASDPRR